MTPVRVMVDQDLAMLSGTFEKIELLNLTVLPVACPPPMFEPATHIGTARVELCRCRPCQSRL